MSKAASVADLHNVEAEKELLACLMHTPSAIDQYQIRSDIFTRQSNKIIFDAINAIYHDPSLNIEHVDIVLLSEYLRHNNTLDKIGGVSAITSINADYVTAENIPIRLNILTGYSRRRKLMEFAADIVQDAQTDADKEASDYAYKLDEIFSGNIKTSVLPNFFDDQVDFLAQFDSNADTITGLDTGINSLNLLTSGLQGGDLIVLAARPHMGKTALALQLILNACKKGKTVAFFSVEQSKEQIHQRLTANCSCIQLNKIKSPGSLTYKGADNDYDKILQVSEKISKFKLCNFYESGIKPSFVATKSYAIKAQKGELDLIVIDHLQIMESDKIEKTTHEKLTSITKELKKLAKSLNVPVLCLSQLSRKVEDRNDKHPMLSDLRESGSIEENADLIMFMYRHDYYNPPAQSSPVSFVELEIQKNRQGERGLVLLHFNCPLMQLREATAEEIKSYNKNHAE